MTKKSQPPGRARATASYAAACALVAIIAVLGTWAFGDRAQVREIVLAAGFAWPVQVGAFALLVRRGASTGAGFVKAWVVGIVARFLTLGAAAILAVRFFRDGGTTLLLGLAALLFVMLLLESRYFRAAYVRS